MNLINGKVKEAKSDFKNLKDFINRREEKIKKLVKT